jgi:hypothetical protein
MLNLINCPKTLELMKGGEKQGRNSKRKTVLNKEKAKL